VVCVGQQLPHAANNAKKASIRLSRLMKSGLLVLKQKNWSVFLRIKIMKEKMSQVINTSYIC